MFMRRHTTRPTHPLRIAFDVVRATVFFCPAQFFSGHHRMHFISLHFIAIYLTISMHPFSALVNQYLKANIATRTYKSSFKLTFYHSSGPFRLVVIFHESFSVCENQSLQCENMMNSINYLYIIIYFISFTF